MLGLVSDISNDDAPTANSGESDRQNLAARRADENHRVIAHRCAPVL